MRAGVAVIAAVAVLTACSSGGRRDGATPSPPAGSDSNVVDGITIPPAYVTPSGTVVPGPRTCPAKFATTLDAAAGGGTFTLTFQRTAHLITCRYQDARAPKGGCSKSTILVNTEPQAFVAFDRWNVETGQNSMWSDNPALEPTPVAGIGIEAEWVPALLELGTGNDTTWVSVFLTCSGSRRSALALAKVLAKQGLASTA